MNRFLRGSAALHAAALAAATLSPRHWRWAAGAVALNQAALTAAGLIPRSSWLGPNLTRLPGNTGAVALTFDDGPDPDVTPHVLDLLDGAGMKGSFFCIGQRARAHPALVRDIARRGHGVENHTEHHPYRFAALPPSGLRREVAEAQDILAELSGRPPSWFRAPMGLRSPLLQPVLEGSGLHLASWTRRALDGVSGNATPALRRLTRGLAAGDVLVMHDGNCRPGPDGRAVVLAVLPPLLRGLRNSALAGARLPDLSGRAA